jgi:hypothetical protein
MFSLFCRTESIKTLSFFFSFRVGPAIGLLLIAYGTGGVKPCLNTFGADQILSSNVKD